MRPVLAAALDRARTFLLVVTAGAPAACGGSGPPTAPASPASPAAPVLTVAGAYQITPSLLQNGCGAVEVLPGPATVAHAPGATALSLTHVGQTYTGTIDARGAFATAPRAIALGNGSTDTVTIAGTFATTGFEATVTVEATHAGAPPCAYSVRWLAAKQGAPNVIP